MSTKTLRAAPPQGQGPGRISQLLPTVKCSNCNAPVPLTELGEHVCVAPPPLPSMSARSPTSLLPARLQGLVKNTPSPPPPSPPSAPRTPEPRSPPPRQNSPLSPRGRSPGPQQRNYTSSPLSPGWKQSMTRASSPLAPMRDRERTASSGTVGSAYSTATATSRNPNPQPQPSPVPRPRSRAEIPPRSPVPAHMPPVPPTPSRDLDDRDRGRDRHRDYEPEPEPEWAPPAQPEPDTKIGGEAGMAGVGRRGFAAAARAAVAVSGWGGGGERRMNTPQYLDINAASSGSSRSATTPPLSPNSGYSSLSHSPGPHSPIPSQPPSPPVSPYESKYRNDNTNSLSTITPKRTDLWKSGHDREPDDLDLDAGPSPALSQSSGSDYGGLAYAASLSDEEDDAPGLSSILRATSGGKDRQRERDRQRELELEREREEEEERERELERAREREKEKAKEREAELERTRRKNQTALKKEPSTSSSASGSVYSRSTNAKSGTGTTRSGLDRAMDALMQDGSSSASSSGSPRAPGLGLVPPARDRERSRDSVARSNTVPHAPLSPAAVSPTSPLPRRARTSAAEDRKAREREEEKERERLRRLRRVRECARCEKRIEDGRWIQMDAGGVLCERCWKNMYLPKCRRCNKPIEKQAVSSSDGQLKGKYHRDCFNCHTCHEPFPDKEFYVFDGKPLCAYHYHEANDSLCAAPSCGRPIEGPCAVSHAGARFHPAHLVCEHAGCRVRLEEYWEVEGRMLCERHAFGSENGSGGGSVAGGGRGRREVDAARRVTRFINLEELGLGGSELR